MMPIIGRKTGVFISRYIHTETQDGKGLIDAHFAKGTAHVDAYLLEGNDAATPFQVAKALMENGGIQNSWTQVVKINPTKHGAFIKKLGPIIRTAQSLIKRSNDFFFEMDLNCDFLLKNR